MTAAEGDPAPLIRLPLDAVMAMLRWTTSLLAFVVMVSFFQLSCARGRTTNQASVSHNLAALTDEQLLAAAHFKKKRGAPRLQEWEILQSTLPAPVLVQVGDSRYETRETSRIMTVTDVLHLVGQPDSRRHTPSGVVLLYDLGWSGNTHHRGFVNTKDGLVVQSGQESFNP